MLFCPAVPLPSPANRGRPSCRAGLCLTGVGPPHVLHRRVAARQSYAQSVTPSTLPGQPALRRPCRWHARQQAPTRSGGPLQPHLGGRFARLRAAPRRQDRGSAACLQLQRPAAPACPPSAGEGRNAAPLPGIPGLKPWNATVGGLKATGTAKGSLFDAQGRSPAEPSTQLSQERARSRSKRMCFVSLPDSSQAARLPALSHHPPQLSRAGASECGDSARLSRFQQLART